MTLMRFSRQQQYLLCIVAAITALYVILATRAFDQPGIYLDAVNPDYLAVRMLDPSSPTSAWVLPGNLLWRRFPLLGGVYHGSIHAYLTLPFYALMGGTVLSLRVAHLFLGILVVLMSGIFIWCVTRSRLATAAALLALVTDPAFILTFRTQAYITTFPIVLVLVGLAQLHAAERRPRRLFVGGLCAGAAVWGYFIYSFMIPGIVLFVAADSLRAWRDDARAGSRAPWQTALRPLVPLLIGIGFGLSPYAVSYASLFYSLGGLHAGLDWLRQTVASLHVTSNQGFGARLEFILWQISMSVTSEWHWRTFFGEMPQPGYAEQVKLAALVLLPLAAVPFAFSNGPRQRAFWLTAMVMVSFVLSATVFGDRLGGHHFCLLLVLLYALASISLSLLTSRIRGRPLRALAFGVPCAAAMAVSLMVFVTFISRLEDRGAAGLYSSLLSDYPSRIRRDGDRTAHVFMDWGGLLQFIYLTEGKVPAYDDSQLRIVACRFGEAKAVYLGADALKRGLKAMQDAGLEVTGIEQQSARGEPPAMVALKVVPPAAFCR
jgi:hypothetical protein